MHPLPPPPDRRRLCQPNKWAGVVPADLYDEALRISGHGDEARPKKPKKGEAPEPPDATARRTRYHPRGFIRVEDTDFGNVPLQRVRVESRRWFNIDSDYTDSRGYFEISSGYLSKVKMSLEFKNEQATTRGMFSGLRFWQAVLPISSDISEYNGIAMQSIDYAVTYQGGLDKLQSRGALVWTACTLFNTLSDDLNFSLTRGIPAPLRGINVWLLPGFPRRSAAPMLRKIGSTSAASIVDFLIAGIPFIGPLGQQVIQRQLPDVLIRYGLDGGARDSPSLQSLLYHELGHVQHYGQVGNNFWTAYIAHIVANLGYGEKTSSGSGRVAISEGWGNYIEEVFMADKYQAPAFNFRAVAAINRLERQTPGDFDTDWFVQGMYHDMTDNTDEPLETGVTDNVTAYTTATVFRGLESDVLSVRDYQRRVNAQNNGVQAPQLEQLVTTYRW